MVDQNSAGWNRVISWLRRLDEIFHAPQLMELARLQA
jgi:hypothetical protein